MVNVWSVCVGDKYSDEDVYILKHMVSQHLEVPHDFFCLSDRQRGDINCFIPDEKWDGWWNKLLLFRYAGGQVLYLDLDVVITGPLLPLLSEKISMPANWAQSGHGGCQSSVMSWNSHVENLGYLTDAFDPDQLTAPGERGGVSHYGLYGKEQLWGDQEYITSMLGNPGDVVVPMQHVYSYKYHCRESLPDDASVVCFHGNPKPDKVGDSWVKAERSYTATRI